MEFRSGKYTGKQSEMTAMSVASRAWQKQTTRQKYKIKIDTIKLHSDFSLKIPIQRLCLWFKSYPQQNFFAEFPSPGSTGNSFLGLSKAIGICQSFLIFQLLDKMVRQQGHWKAKHPNQDCAGLKKIKVMYKIASSTEPYKDKLGESVQL